MISKKEKENQVTRLSEGFLKSKGTFLVNCIGMNVAAMTDLRKTLKSKQSTIQVVKNTLARLSLEEHSDMKPVFSKCLAGTNAFVMVFGEDVSGVAKVIDEMAEDNEAFEIKCGVLNGVALLPEAIKSLAQLPSHEVLQAQFLAVLSAPIQKFLSLLQAPSRTLLRVLDSYKQTKN